MNKVSLYKQVACLAVLVGVFLFSGAAFAVTLPNQAKNPPQQGNGFGQINSQRKSVKIVKVKLQDAKLRACQAREKSIKNRFAHLADLAKKMEDKFDAIAKRVQDYYTNTVVPSGKTVANYDALVLDIQTKKTAVQNALTKTQNDVSGFSCTSDNPKEAMMEFKENMQIVKQALKDYRTSIKNLIVAVRSVTGEDNN